MKKQDYLLWDQYFMGIREFDSFSSKKVRKAFNGLIFLSNLHFSLARPTKIRYNRRG